MQQNFYSNPAMGSAAGTWGPQAFPGTYNYMGARPQVQMPVFSNPMTEEEHKLLLNDGGFNTTRNKLDVIRDMCTHKHNGQICVFERPDHLVQCSYCGKVWEMKDNYTHEDVENLVEEIVSVIETIKTFLPSVSPDLARQLFAALGMIELIPSMFDYAMDTLNKMKNATGGIMPNQSSDYANTLNALWGLTGAVTPGMPQYGNYMASQLYNQFGAPAQPWGAAAPAGGKPEALCADRAAADASGQAQKITRKHELPPRHFSGAGVFLAFISQGSRKIPQLWACPPHLAASP